MVIAAIPIDKLEEIGKRFLRNDEAATSSLLIVHHCNECHPVACLISQNETWIIVLALCNGANLVGRGSSCSYHAFRRELAGVLEGAQWKFSYSSGIATANDAGSTNGSVIVRRSDRNTELRMDTLLRRGIGIELNLSDEEGRDTTVIIADGDVLVNAYLPFVYCVAE